MGPFQKIVSERVRSTGSWKLRRVRGTGSSGCVMKLGQNFSEKRYEGGYRVEKEGVNMKQFGTEVERLLKQGNG